DEYVAARELAPTAWLQRPRAEWLELLQAADVAVVPVLRPGEGLDHEQVKFNDIEIDAMDEEHGPLRQVGPPTRVPKNPAGRPASAPARGAHNGRVEELLRPVATRAPLEQSELQHPLDGVRVLDFAQWFAGPYGGKILSDLGADVIKIEAPAHDPMRWLPDPFEAASRGKRTIAGDLKSAAGPSVIPHLVRSGGVGVANFRPGEAAREGHRLDAP